jgi:predicted PurR-regulated permease PerM
VETGHGRSQSRLIDADVPTMASAPAKVGLEPTLPLPRGFNVLLTAAAAMIVVAGMRAFSASIGPIFLALVIVVVVRPVQTGLLKRGAPGWVALLALLASSFGVLIVIVLALIWSAAELVGLIGSPRYEEQLSDFQTQIGDLLTEQGFTDLGLDELIASIDLGAVAGQITNAVSGLLGLTSAISLLMITMLFMVLDADKFDQNLRHVALQRPTVVDALTRFATSTRSYFVVSTGFGFIVAVLDVVALEIMGIPLPLVWGVLSLITNYIPNIGFVLGLIPPALLAFFDGGWQLSLTVIVVYFVINLVIQSLIQPRVVGDAVGLSATLTFLSLIFWGWVLGVLGALLAVPMTLLAKALLVDVDPTTRWAGPLISLIPGQPDDGYDVLAEAGESTATNDGQSTATNAGASAATNAATSSAINAEGEPDLEARRRAAAEAARRNRT